MGCSLAQAEFQFDFLIIYLQRLLSNRSRWPTLAPDGSELYVTDGGRMVPLYLGKSDPLSDGGIYLEYGCDRNLTMFPPCRASGDPAYSWETLVERSFQIAMAAARYCAQLIM